MVDLPMECWVIAAGDTNRNYTDICLKNDVILMGPSYCGPWNAERNDGKGNLITAPQILEENGWSSRKRTNINTFVNEISKGDLVVLRLGTSEVHGVGIVESSYEYNNLFSDIDGWDIAHTRRVNWIWAKPDGEPKVFDKALNWGDTCQKFTLSKKNETIFDWIKSLPSVQYSPKKLPQAGKELKVSDITTKLFNYGLGSGSLSKVEDSIKDICHLAEWYQNYDVQPSEYETVTHLVYPLLLSLGWTPQRLCLEYKMPNSSKKADIAFFPNADRKSYEPFALVEAKRFGQSCLSAENQIRNYAANHKFIRRIIVTDGIRYGIFVSWDNEKNLPQFPTAYLNLTDLRDEYPVYGECRGADEALLYLSAGWNHRFNHPDLPLRGEEKI